jgi:hypothetical protein
LRCACIRSTTSCMPARWICGTGRLTHVRSSTSSGLVLMRTDYRYTATNGTNTRRLAIDPVQTAGVNTHPVLASLSVSLSCLRYGKIKSCRAGTGIVTARSMQCERDARDERRSPWQLPLPIRYASLRYSYPATDTCPAFRLRRWQQCPGRRAHECRDSPHRPPRKRKNSVQSSKFRRLCATRGWADSVSRWN